MFVIYLLQKPFHFLRNKYYPLLGPYLWLLNLIGMWRSETIRGKKFNSKLITIYITIGFFFSQYIKCCVKRSLHRFMLIIQYAPFHTGVIKTAFFIKDHDKWCELIEYVSSIEREELSKGDPEIKRIIRSYIKYSHRLTFFFWLLGTLSNLSIFGDLYQKVFVENNMNEEYINIFDGYTPWSRDPPGYYYIFITQTLFANIITVYVMGWDTLVISLMIFFAGQLKISGIYCKKAIDVNSAFNSHKNIAECHRFHTTLARHQETFNCLISPVMFAYLVVISVNLGVCIIEMSQLQDNYSALFSYCVYVLACLVQLLLFYWHSNEVTEESTLVSYNTFKSNWVVVNVQLQREIAILAHVTAKRLIFRAGPFNEMCLTTFVSILRGSYSFYTLLSETN